MSSLLRPTISLLLAWALVQGGGESVALVSSPEEAMAEVDAGELPPPHEAPSPAPVEPPADGADESPETDDTACDPGDESPPGFASARLCDTETEPGDAVLEQPSPPPRS